MSKAVWAVVVAFVAGIAGAVLTFIPPKTIISIGLGFGRHNDRVLVGVLLLVVAVVSAYKLMDLLFGRPTVASEKSEKKTAKPKKSKKGKR